MQEVYESLVNIGVQEISEARGQGEKYDTVEVCLVLLNAYMTPTWKAQTPSYYWAAKQLLDSRNLDAVHPLAGYEFDMFVKAVEREALSLWLKEDEELRHYLDEIATSVATLALSKAETTIYATTELSKTAVAVFVANSAMRKLIDREMVR